MTARRIFWLFLALILAASFHYRQAGFDIANLGYKFGRLYFTKELVIKLIVVDTSIYVYAEPVNGRSLRFVDIENLQPIKPTAGSGPRIVKCQPNNAPVTRQGSRPGECNDRRLVGILHFNRRNVHCACKN